ncbi:GmrSD restriction endonuclease domain-containing protein [Pseudanabaena sp. Chao 1811]|uniref:GmrSD restriction endonuclease domain-containing protein n=1 Tax=Pseudanabaena sp. Chao 1811 TaxID=2963092 RepID=UPI0022F380ED|nr:DUF1524 domain-containing protein [Pseudanabaena sp. Chao 1811]
MPLIEKKANRKIDNEGYSEKIEVFQEICFKITSAIPEKYDQWNEAKISSRQMYFAGIATAIWKVDLLRKN